MIMSLREIFGQGNAGIAGTPVEGIYYCSSLVIPELSIRWRLTLCSRLAVIVLLEADLRFTFGEGLDFCDGDEYCFR